MTPKEAAEELNLSYSSILYHIKRGNIKAEKIGRRWQVDSDSVAAWQPPDRDYDVPGRPPEPGSLSPAENGRRSIYLGTQITPIQIAQIRQAIEPDLRARILLHLAGMESDILEHTLENLGIRTNNIRG